jgi:AraC family transcriptional regulator
MTSMKLFRGEFGHVSVLNVASDLVTHAHPEMHIIIWLEGSAGEMLVGEHSIALGPGIAVGVNSLEPHSHSFDSGSRPGLFLAFYIDPNWARFRRALPAGAQPFKHPAIPINEWLHRATVDLFDRLATDQGGDDLVQYETERLIDSLMDAADAAQSQGLPASRTYTRPDFRVRKAIELMKANVSERMSLDEVARSVGLSRPHFFSLFKEQTNLTPNVYWNTLRMEEALRQLQSTEDPLTAVACNLGFTSQGNFTRFFRDHAGVPPTLYREAARAAG